ncbi:hypothetical protein LEMLEM_LOCUS22703, partial [Lemmus lemmus]
ISSGTVGRWVGNFVFSFGNILRPLICSIRPSKRLAATGQPGGSSQSSSLRALAGVSPCLTDISLWWISCRFNQTFGAFRSETK